MNGRHSAKKKFHSVEISDELTITNGQAVFEDNDDVDRVCLQVNNLGTAGNCIRSAATPNGDGYFIATVIGEQSWAFGTEQSTKNFVLADSGSLGANQRLTVAEGGKTTITINEAAFAPALTLENNDSGDLALEIHGEGSQADAVVFCHTDDTAWTFGARQQNSSFAICQSTFFNSNDDKFNILENGQTTIAGNLIQSLVGNVYHRFSNGTNHWTVGRLSGNGKFFISESQTLGANYWLTIENSNGYVGLGNITDPSYLLHLASDSAGKPSTDVWTIVSDGRLKEEVEPADLQICYDNIKKLELKRFKWKDTYVAETGIKDLHRCGFIAQDIEKTYPKSVKTHTFPKDAPKHGLTEMKDLNMSNHNMSHFGATQKLIEMVEDLRERVAALEAQLIP